MDNVEFPIVAANLDTSGSPQLILAKNLVKSTVLQIDGAKVGVIGYVTPEVQNLTMTKEPIFVNEIEAIKYVCNKQILPENAY